MALEDTAMRGVRASYGARNPIPHNKNQVPSEISNFLRPIPTFNSKFINILPTEFAKPFDKNGASLYTSVALNGGALTGDVNRVDPSNALSMAKITIPAANANYQGINYYDRGPIYLNPRDTWIVIVYIPDTIPANLTIQLAVNNLSTLGSVTNARTMEWSAVNGQLCVGYNILMALHVEDKVETNEFGRVGTTFYNEWVNLGTQTDTTAANSIRIRCKIDPGPAADTNVYFGGIYTAPANWCKAAIIWSADDVPKSFYDLAIPVIESYGWKTTLNTTSAYAGDPAGQKMSIEEVIDSYTKGHEIWGHTRLHENLDTSTLAEKTTALTVSRDFWRSRGIHSASKFMAYPFGAYDTETIELLPTLGYKLATTIEGVANSPWIPAVNPYTISRSNVELTNSWHVDSLINGCILRGQSVFTYMHEAREGGSNTNVRPAASEFYIDHLKRWCDLIKNYENQGKVIVTTGLEYYKLCSIDPWVDDFLS